MAAGEISVAMVQKMAADVGFLQIFRPQNLG
jgi:hypothetical protein